MEFSLKNDALVHLILERSKPVLKNLICCLKGLKEEDIKDVTLLSTISLNDAMKELVLDIRVLLNNDEQLDIELQFYYDTYFKERALLYLCRMFDSLKRGEKIDHLKTATLIVITDMPIFDETREFYSRFLLRSENDAVYTRKFALNVLQCNRTELATAEDVDNGLLTWAKAFMAKTWEDLRALAQQNPVFTEVANEMYKLSAEEEQAQYLRRREKYLLQMADMTYEKELLEKTLAEAMDALAKRDEALAKRDEELDGTKKELDGTRKVLAEKDDLIASLKAQLAEATK